MPDSLKIEFHQFPPETEADFMSWVLDLARTYGWKAAHFRGAWDKEGKRFTTPVQADGQGFPDLCLVRGNRLIFAELKSARGKPSDEQYRWLLWLASATKEAYLWRPKDRDDIERILK